MAGVVDEAEDAYSSGAPGLILLVFFSGSLHASLFYVDVCLMFMDFEFVL